MSKQQTIYQAALAKAAAEGREAFARKLDSLTTVCVDQQVLNSALSTALGHGWTDLAWRALQLGASPKVVQDVLGVPGGCSRADLDAALVASKIAREVKAGG